MSTVIQFTVLGLGVGAAYAILAQGLVVVNRGSGVVNFGHAGIAVFTALIYAAISKNESLAPGVAAVLLTLGAGVFGLVMYMVAIRPLNNASNLARTIAALAVLVILEASATLMWGTGSRVAPSLLPSGVHEVGGITIPESRIYLLIIAVVLTAALWLVFHRSLPGLATSANAENARASAALGWSPDVLAAGTWALGGALAGFAGIMLGAFSGVDPAAMTTLLVVALAAALLGRMTSFPWVLVGSLGIGVLQALAGNYISRQGIAESIPFFVIVAVLVFQGRRLPLPSSTVERFAQLGTGLVRPKVVVPVVFAFCVLSLTVFGAQLHDALIGSLGFSIVVLSIVVLTGYAGQLSLAQFAFGGIGALITAKLVSTQGWPLELAMVVGVVATVPVGMAFALLALRVRGTTLAIITLGLGTALASIIFNYSPITGGPEGTPVGPQTFLGIDIDATRDPAPYTVLVGIAFTICALAVANLRRSRAGRRLVAVRANERAAAALGIDVYAAKVYAFGLASAIAALGGIMIGFQFQTILYETFYTQFESILAVAFAVVGGLGYIGGALIAGTFIAGGIGPLILETVFSGIDRYIPLIGGILLLVLLLKVPDGLAPAHIKDGHALLAKLRSRFGRADAEADRPAKAEKAAPRLQPQPVEPKVLEVSGLEVRFGGVVAVDGASIRVEPGKVTGLIGPNGAGKTTLISAVTGFVTPSAGAIDLSGTSISGWATHRRARAGLARSFQSLELFEDLTVRENLRVSADSRDLGSYFTGLVVPRDPPLPTATLLAIQELELEEYLDRLPTELPYGRRRLVAVARALASAPSVLMLDEPATGLDQSERQEFGRLVRRLAASWNLAILIVEHDVELVMTTCDSVTVLDFGKQIASGTPQEVRQNRAVIAAYLGEPGGEQDANPEQQVRS